MARIGHEYQYEWGMTEKRLVIGALCIIALVVYAMGAVWRSHADPSHALTAQLNPADDHTPSPQAIAQMPTATLPLPTPLPTDTPPATTMSGPVDSTSTPSPTAVLPTPLPTNTPDPSAPAPGLPPLELAAVVTTEAGVNVRLGPGTDFDKVALLLKDAQVIVIRRTVDSQWVKVRVAQPETEGWVSAEFLQITGDLNRVAVQTREAVALLLTPTATLPPAPTDIPAANACVSVVGDSIGYGEVIFEIPQVGFMHIKMAPFAYYMQEQIKLRGYDKPATDRSFPGIGITSPRHKSYYTLSIWKELLADRCKYTVIMPWVNDLSSGLDPAESAPLHAQNLAEFATRLIENNPEGKLIFLNYYSGAPAPFSINMAWGFTPQAIQLHNQAMFQTCTQGPLSRLSQVICLDSAAAFSQVGTAYVVGPMRRAEIETVRTAPMRPEDQKLLDFYTSNNPDGLLIGDGIHLSSLGKTVLAAYVANEIAKLEGATR
ncbi:MAG: hypothetical protein OHK0023_06510 [Anaerolineae bacterium]